MSNAKKLSMADRIPCSPCASASTPDSSTGATATLSDSSTRCFTGSWSGQPASFAATDQGATDAVAEPTARPDCTQRVCSVAACIQPDIAPESVVELLGAGARVLGADQAAFVSFVRDDGLLSSCRFTLACDPAWCREYLAEAGPTSDPWLAYATHHCEPLIASSLGTDPAQQRILDIAARYGFRSTVLAPVHSGAGHSRSSVLYLGSAEDGYFEEATGTEASRLLRIGARMLAGQLHDWWLARIRRQLLRRARLSDTELMLLRYEHLGWSSKQIAGETSFSKNSVDSRFHRINIKLGVPSRRAAARVAIECGLING